MLRTYLHVLIFILVLVTSFGISYHTKFSSGKASSTNLVAKFTTKFMACIFFSRGPRWWRWGRHVFSFGGDHGGGGEDGMFFFWWGPRWPRRGRHVFSFGGEHGGGGGVGMYFILVRRADFVFGSGTVEVLKTVSTTRSTSGRRPLRL